MLTLSQPLIALAEGFALALSPCILPVLPLILAGGALGDKKRPFVLIAGFIISFSVFTLLARAALNATGIGQDSVQIGAFALLLIFGLVMLIPSLENRFANWTSGVAGRAQNLSHRAEQKSGIGSGLLMGALIGVVWTPCAGPLLAAALLQVIQAQTDFGAAITIFAFAVGAGVPMLLVALFGQFFTAYLRQIARHAVLIRRVMGAVIVVFAGLGLAGINIGAVWVTSQPMTIATLPAPQNVAMHDGGLQDGLAAPYSAPDLAGIHAWLNSPPLDLQSLRGKVVLIDFWTYSCINCIRTLPYLTRWDTQYRDQGLVIIGVHSPEFAFEGKLENVQAAVAKFGIQYPVALDNDFATWKNFKNEYWPAHYLINRNGQVVYTHFGEGKYDVTENNIRHLLALGRANIDPVQSVTVESQSPETYLGSTRAERRVLDQTSTLPLHSWRLGGQWLTEAEFSQSTAVGDTLEFHFDARKVFLVMASSDGQPRQAKITVNGQSVPAATMDVQNDLVTVGNARLYELYHGATRADATIRIEAQEPGLQVYAFTFEN
jgi:cytochrome c biogenesis protein CcdA/thiol-disulfide isomerase/thioredoxin